MLDAMTDNESKLEEAVDAISDKAYDKALSILLPLAEEELPGAVGMLGFLYQCGEGVELDAPKAVELLTKAVELGDGTAAHNLGTVFSTGLPGVGQDAEKSKYYYRKAKEMGAQYAPDEFYE
jgi:TPR repeat protein